MVETYTHKEVVVVVTCTCKAQEKVVVEICTRKEVVEVTYTHMA